MVSNPIHFCSTGRSYRAANGRCRHGTTARARGPAPSDQLMPREGCHVIPRLVSRPTTVGNWVNDKQRLALHTLLCEWNWDIALELSAGWIKHKKEGLTYPSPTTTHLMACIGSLSLSLSCSLSISLSQPSRLSSLSASKETCNVNKVLRASTGSPEKVEECRRYGNFSGSSVVCPFFSRQQPVKTSSRQHPGKRKGEKKKDWGKEKTPTVWRLLPPRSLRVISGPSRRFKHCHLVATRRITLCPEWRLQRWNAIRIALTKVSWMIINDA